MASGVDARLLKSTKFPPEFNKKVDMQKVNLQVMKKLVTVLLHSSLVMLTPQPTQMDRKQNLRNLGKRG